MENPISSPIQSIILKSSLSTEDSDFDIELMKNNKFCQFERMELEESVNNVFPTGALIVRDTSDILTYIAANEIKSIIVSLGDGDTSEKYEWSITSITYANNAISEIDQTFVVIYFTNKLFQESQGKSFYDEIEYVTDSNGDVTANPISLWDIPYPFVTTPEHIIKTYGYRSVFSKPLFTKMDSEGNEVILKGCGVNNYIKNNFEPKNAVLFRPKVSDATRQEQYQTNIISYLNYIFTYAVSAPAGSNQLKPYYMFWTDFTNCLNYKFFDLRSDLATDKYKFDLDSTDPYHVQPYGVYDSPDVERLLKNVDGEEIACKKIYVLVTNPAASIINKNYYYVRETPIYMEIPSFGISGSTTDPVNLMSPYMSESANTHLTTVTKYTENVSGVTYTSRTMAIEDANLTYLPDSGFHGYASDFSQNNTKINTTDAVSSYESLLNHIESTPLGLRDSYQQPNPQTPLYPFNDNPYIWQFQYDMTRTHPNLVRVEDGDVISVEENDFYENLSQLLNTGDGTIPNAPINAILSSLSLNKVLKAKYKAMEDQTFYDNYRRKQLEQTEKENFVANVLCCIGDDLTAKEDWFFAKITGFIPDNRKLRDGIGIEGNDIKLGAVADAWLYSWKKLEPGPLFVGLTAGVTADIERFASYHSMMHGWTTSPCIGSTGMPDPYFIEQTYYGDSIPAMKHGGVFPGMGTWAINLNERLNGQNDNKFTIPSAPVEKGTDTKNYRGPGYFKDNITTNGQFAYKPIGFTGSLFTHSNALPNGPGYDKWESASHIVKMYKIRVNKLREMGCIPPAPNLGNEYMYYFIAENAVDGIC